jgi:hypothetical protein
LSLEVVAEVEQSLEALALEDLDILIPIQKVQVSQLVLSLTLFQLAVAVAVVHELLVVMAEEVLH